MAIIKPFKGIRPPAGIASKLASRPYDVLNSEEARVEAQGNDYSLLHIIKPEIDLDSDIDVHSEEVYNKAKENFLKFQSNAWLVQDEKENYYVYAQTMNGRTQYGLVACASVEDYMDGVVKKHELTRPDKEEDRMKHVRINDANIEPVFFTYPALKELDSVINNVVTSNTPVYDFVAEDGIGHQFWVVDNDKTIENITELFKKVPSTYVADGHHRTAAAALVGNEKKRNNPNHTGSEEYNYFLAVHFPEDQLSIIDYNRLIKDLNHMEPAEFLLKLESSFELVKKGREIYTPEHLHNFSMYLEGDWYSLTAKEGALWTLNITLPIESRIILPFGAAVVDLNQIPTNIGTVDERPFMDFESGELSLYYLIGLPSIVNESESSIEESSSYIDRKTSDGIVFSEASLLLQTAESAYQSENYALAKSIAEQALELAQLTVNDAEKAQQALTQAETAIESATTQGRTEGLDSATQSYDSGISSYEAGDYSTAETHAKTAVQLAQTSIEVIPSEGNSLMYVGLGVILVGAVGGFLFMQKQGKTEVQASSVSVDLDQVFSEHRDLRLEDREVIKFLAGSNGEAFASEIRDRFDLPRSSAWRLIRRLEGLEIIEETKVGNQSLIRLQSKYHS